MGFFRASTKPWAQVLVQTFEINATNVQGRNQIVCGSFKKAGGRTLSAHYHTSARVSFHEDLKPSIPA
jgi:hypothetical protein